MSRPERSVNPRQEFAAALSLAPRESIFSRELSKLEMDDDLSVDEEESYKKNSYIISALCSTKTQTQPQKNMYQHYRDNQPQHVRSSSHGQEKFVASSISTQEAGSSSWRLLKAGRSSKHDRGDKSCICGGASVGAADPRCNCRLYPCFSNGNATAASNKGTTIARTNADVEGETRSLAPSATSDAKSHHNSQNKRKEQIQNQAFYDPVMFNGQTSANDSSRISTKIRLRLPQVPVMVNAEKTSASAQAATLKSPQTATTSASCVNAGESRVRAKTASITPPNVTASSADSSAAHQGSGLKMKSRPKKNERFSIVMPSRDETIDIIKSSNRNLKNGTEEIHSNNIRNNTNDHTTDVLQREATLTETTQAADMVITKDMTLPKASLTTISAVGSPAASRKSFDITPTTKSCLAKGNASKSTAPRISFSTKSSSDAVVNSGLTQSQPILTTSSSSSPSRSSNSSLTTSTTSATSSQKTTSTTASTSKLTIASNSSSSSPVQKTPAQTSSNSSTPTEYLASRSTPRSIPTRSQPTSRYDGATQVKGDESKGKPTQLAMNVQSLADLVPPFSWDTYLKFKPSEIAPKEAFMQSLEHPVNNFKPGMKLEAKDLRSNSWCLASVISCEGMRLRLRFDGGDYMNDVWELINSENIRRVGLGDEVYPPMNYKGNIATYSRFVVKELSKPTTILAPGECFYPSPEKPENNLFVPGMKLEATDKKNPYLICPATIGEVNGDEVSITFDGWRGSFDYKCKYYSRDLFPINWCYETGHAITKPNGWDAYFERGPEKKELRSTNSTPRSYVTSSPTTTKRKPVKVSPQTTKLTPQATTKKATKGVNIAHSTQPPTTLVIDEEEVACDEDDLLPTESNELTCQRTVPYEDWRLSKEKMKIESSSTTSPPEGEESSVVNSSTETYTDVSISNSTVTSEPQASSEDFFVADTHARTSDEPSVKKLRVDESSKNIKNGQTVVESPSNWAVTDVINHINSDESLTKYGEVFANHEIDGKALLLLTTEVMINHMGLKIGPALKINDLIDRLKRLN